MHKLQVQIDKHISYINEEGRLAIRYESQTRQDINPEECEILMTEHQDTPTGLVRLQVRIQGHLDAMGVRKAGVIELMDYLVNERGFDKENLAESPSLTVEWIPVRLSIS